MAQTQNSVTIDGVCYSLDTITFDDIRYKYGTGRSINVGRGEKRGYRVGVMTNIGDIEETVWMSTVRCLIVQTGEQALFANLLEWVNDEVPWTTGKKDTEMYALQLFADRIFDDPEWVDYIGFNAKYRPEVLKNSKDLALVSCDCCQKPIYTTTQQIRRCKSIDRRIECPHCKKYVLFKVLKKSAKFVQ